MIRTYEFNIKLALIIGDLSEFNQCQTVLGSHLSILSQKQAARWIANQLLYDIFMVWFWTSFFSGPFFGYTTSFTSCSVLPMFPLC